jgi:hypothetical protein
VAPPTYRLHEQFMKKIGESVENEDPTNKLLDVQMSIAIENGSIPLNARHRMGA